jgi:hypothetical protein
VVPTAHLFLMLKAFIFMEHAPFAISEVYLSNSAIPHWPPLALR